MGPLVPYSDAGDLIRAAGPEFLRLCSNKVSEWVETEGECEAFII